jgi:hypothetical protein
MLLPSIESILSIPAALAPSVLMTFKRWYYNRIPLRMAKQKDIWAQCEQMLNTKAIDRSQI